MGKKNTRNTGNNNAQNKNHSNDSDKPKVGGSKTDGNNNGNDNDNRADDLVNLRAKRATEMTKAIVASFVFGICLFSGFFSSLFYDEDASFFSRIFSSLENNDYYLWIILLILVIMLFSVWLIIVIANSSGDSARSNAIIEQQEKKKSVLGELVRKKNNLENITFSEIIIAELMESSESMVDFRNISLEQGKKSFNWSIVFFFVGLVLFGASAIPVVFLGKEVNYIGVISGAIVELISATMILVYKKSIEQLNYYHEALRENEKIIMAIKLVDNLSKPEKCDEAYMEIIRSQLSRDKKSMKQDDKEDIQEQAEIDEEEKTT